MTFFNKFKKTIPYSDEKGRTLVETLGVLVVVGAMSTAGMQVISSANNRFKLHRARNQITETVKSIRGYYGNDRGYFGDVSPQTEAEIKESVLDNRLVPKEMVAGTNIRLATGGLIDRFNITADNGFSFVITDVQNMECLGIIDTFSDLGNKSKGPFRIDVVNKSAVGTTIHGWTWTGATSCTPATNQNFTCLNRANISNGCNAVAYPNLALKFSFY